MAAVCFRRQRVREEIRQARQQIRENDMVDAAYFASC